MEQSRCVAEPAPDRRGLRPQTRAQCSSDSTASGPDEGCDVLMRVEACPGPSVKQPLVIPKELSMFLSFAHPLRRSWTLKGPATSQLSASRITTAGRDVELRARDQERRNPQAPIAGRTESWNRNNTNKSKRGGNSDICTCCTHHARERVPLADPFGI